MSNRFDYTVYRHDNNNDIVASDVEHMHQFHPSIQPNYHERKMEKSQQPKLARLYNSFVVNDNSLHTNDYTFKGSFTTIASTLVATTVNMSNNYNPINMVSFPVSPVFYVGIKSFSIAPQAPVTTLGNIECEFIPYVGGSIGLGEYANNTAARDMIKTFSTIPFTDSGSNSLGTLNATLNNGSASTGTYNFMIVFSFSYILPESGPDDSDNCMICKHKSHMVE